jgi:hypothetical protein
VSCCQCLDAGGYEADALPAPQMSVITDHKEEMKFNFGLNSLVKRIGLVPSVLLVLGFLSLIGGNKIRSGFFLSSAIAWYYMATSTSSIGYYPDPSVTLWDKKPAAIAIMFGLFAIVSLACAQSEEPKRKTFHVTEVRQVNADDYCTMGRCSATKIEVSGGYLRSET